MIPVICKIGPFSIYSYGLMLALAVLICSFFLRREAVKNKIDPELVVDLVFWVVVGGVVGARIFFILLNLNVFIDNPLEIVMLQKGGLAWQGSIIFGSWFGVWFIRKKKMNLLSTLDMSAPYLALGQAIGRLGCFLNGCCYGRPWEHGIYFPLHGAKLHPTQIYLSVGAFGVFIFLAIYKKVKTAQGEIFWMYIILDSVVRFFVEFFRADHFSLFFGLSVYQIVSLVLIAVGVYAKFFLKSRQRV